MAAAARWMPIATVLAAGVLAACRAPLSLAPCDDDAACPAGHRCDPLRHYCFGADAGGADAALADGALEDGRAGHDAIRADGTSPGDSARADASTADSSREDAAASEDVPLADGAGGADGPASDGSATDGAGVADGGATDGGSASTLREVVRSVGPGQVEALVEGDANNPALVQADSLQVEQDLPLRVGVGDVVVYDSDGDGGLDARAFLVERINARSFVLQPDLDGAVAPSAASTAAWAIFRAYTSLASAVAFAENPGIAAELRDFDPFGSPPDLVARNLSWRIACYADGVDTGRVAITGWNTDAQHGLRIFTPTALEEVGMSQRHAGLWTESGAYLLRQTESIEQVWIRNPFVELDGLQVDVTVATWVSVGISVQGLQAAERVVVRHCIVRGQGVSEGIENLGIEIWDSAPSAELQVSNSLVYGFGGAAEDRCALCAYEGTLVAVNNTLADSSYALDAVQRDATQVGTVLAVNNLITGCQVAGRGAFATGTRHNATDLLSLGYTLAGSSANDRVQQQFQFVDKAQANFHLTVNDTGARDQGAAATSYGVTDDLDGQARTGTWDIGADELVF